jgi:hypothetical protein
MDRPNADRFNAVEVLLDFSRQELMNILLDIAYGQKSVAELIEEIDRAVG